MGELFAEEGDTEGIGKESGEQFRQDGIDDGREEFVYVTADGQGVIEAGMIAGGVIGEDADEGAAGVLDVGDEVLDTIVAALAAAKEEGGHGWAGVLVVLDVGPFLGILAIGDEAGGFDDLGGGELGGGAVGAMADEEEVIVTGKDIHQAADGAGAFLKGVFDGISGGEEMGAKSISIFLREAAGEHREMEGKQVMDDEGHAVGAHAGDDVVIGVGQGGDGAVENVAAGPGKRRFGITGDGDGERVDVFGDAHGFDGAGDAAGDGGGHDESIAGEFGVGIDEDITAGIHGVEAESGDAAEFVEEEARGETGVVGIAAAGEDDLADVLEIFRGEGGTDAIIDDGDLRADEGGEGEDFGLHGVDAGHGISFDVVVC